MRILLIRFSSIGDLVLQTPVASWLKQEFPDCRVSFLTAHEFTSVLDGHPHIDEVIPMERFRGKGAIRKLFRFSRSLINNGKYDLIIDLHSNTRSRLIGIFNPKVKSIRVDKRKLERNIFVALKKNCMANISSIHWRNIEDIASVLGRTFDRQKFQEQMKSLSPGLGATSLAGSKELILEKQRKKIVISAVASFAPKRWPINMFYELISEIFNSSDFDQYEVVVLGGKEDEYLQPLMKFEELASKRFQYLQGKTSLSETINIIKDSRLCVGNDTGLGHIAEAFGIPSIVLFGPTHPSFGFGSHLEKSVNLRVPLPCSPCSTLGNRPCKFETQHCMQNLAVKDVFEHVKRICLSDI